MGKKLISVKVNGRTLEKAVEPRTLLVHFLREECQLTGAHIGCETSHCGACTVDIDGRSVKGCTHLAVQCDGADVLTVESTLADHLDELTVGDVVTFVGGSTLEVLGAGTSEGAAWLEVFQTGDGGTPRRVWVDELAKDETPVEYVGQSLELHEPAIVATHERIDADADDAAWPDDEEGESDDFDTVV